MNEHYRRKPNVACQVCGKFVYRRPSVIKRNEGRTFCGAGCYGISCRNESPCIVCGKPIMARFNKKTCSRACANKNRVGIIYTGRRLKDNVATQKSLKSRLIEARGRKCERCGYSKTEILQVHHQDRNRTNNNLDNLALICPNCHYEDHYLYGKKPIRKK